MKKGDVARLIQPTIQGPVTATRYNEETEGLEHLLEWTDAAGEVHQRWFAAAELEEVAQ